MALRITQQDIDEAGLFRLHTSACKEHYKRTDREHKDCDCMIHFEGKIGSEFIRQSMKTRAWGRAIKALKERREAQRWSLPTEEPEQDQSPSATSKPIREAVAAYLDASGSRKGKNLANPTISKYRTLLNRLVEFSEQRGYVYMDDLTYERLDAFKESWPLHSIDAIRNAITRMRSFYDFCMKRDWCKKHIASDMEHPEEEFIDIRPFTEAEEERILERCRLYAFDPQQCVTNEEVETFCLVMRYSGLAIADTALLQASEVVGDTINYFRKKLRRRKKRRLVTVPIPHWLVKRLNRLPLQQGKYFFCHGKDEVGAATDVWHKRLGYVYEAAGIRSTTNSASHRWRHTFATRLLDDGEDINNVSQWLGHDSIKTTEKYYDHWNKKRRDLVNDKLRQRYASMPAPTTPAPAVTVDQRKAARYDALRESLALRKHA